MPVVVLFDGLTSLLPLLVGGFAAVVLLVLASVDGFFGVLLPLTVEVRFFTGLVMFEVLPPSPSPPLTLMGRPSKLDVLADRFRLRFFFFFFLDVGVGVVSLTATPKSIEASYSIKLLKDAIIM